jgi:hypothetical protein
MRPKLAHSQAALRVLFFSPETTRLAQHSPIQALRTRGETLLAADSGLYSMREPVGIVRTITPRAALCGYRQRYANSR